MLHFLVYQSVATTQDLTIQIILNIICITKDLQFASMGLVTTGIHNSDIKI